MASRIDAPEPASAALRKLIQEAVAVCLCGLPTCDSCRREGEANVTLRYALPALADSVAAVERHNGRCPYLQCALCSALAALRERLEARP